MKKYLLITFLCIIISSTASAQNAIARLKFEDAEIAYSKKDYPTALSSLKEAEQILKATNPKLLHLKIMIMSTMVKTRDFVNDPEYTAEAIKDSEFYLKTYENVANNEDKYREVYEARKDLKANNPYGETLKLALKGDPKAQYKIAKEYSYLSKKREDRVEYWYNKAALAGDMEAMIALGNYHMIQDPDQGESEKQATQKNRKNALKFYEMAANKDDPESMFWTALIYASGEAKNIQKSVLWMDKAADMGYPQAATSIGVDCYTGTMARQQSDSKALLYLNKAVNLIPKDEADSTSLTEACFNLILLYYSGIHIPKDYKKVEEYSNKIIALKNKTYTAFAMVNLADIYRIGGYGVTQDYSKSFNLYNSAMKLQKGGRGYYGIALLYKLGNGVKRDKSSANEYTALAVDWLTKGAQNSYPYLFALNELYRSGVLVEPNIKLADEYKAKLDAYIASRHK